MTSTSPKGFTVAELETELKWPQSTIRNKVFQGDLKAQRYGNGRLRIFEEDNAEAFADRRAFLAGEKPQ
ncbi:hypothetical protein IAD21_00951 [Abditibacteriota bacterium]|nr:hypothetical protein IAD21_00951 [Abditibacteriota bacterium]